MITEAFLNSCFSIVLNENSHAKKNLSLYRDVFEVVSYCDNQKTIEIPMAIKTKFDAIKKICKMKLEDGKEIDSIIDSILFSEKYKPLSDFILSKRKEELKEHITVDIIRQLRLRKKINSLFSNYDNLTKFIESIEDGTFDSIDDAVLDYEDIIKNLYTNMMQANRGVAIESSSSLDLEKDEYSDVLDLILKKYERSNTTPTGYPILDNEILNGGFEASRVYIFGGGSGSGKSTMLNNLILNAATQFPKYLNEDSTSTKNVYVYITCENTIEESLLRTYQPLFNKTMVEVIRDIKNGIDIKQCILNELRRTNSTIIMKYFPAMSISTLDIMSVLDDVLNEYGKNCIKGVYIDYLDLLRSDIKYDIYRMELGAITLSLKTMAVEYNIPVITATQLGRSAYTTEESRDLNLNQISESIKKVEHADCVILLIKDQTINDIVHCKVAKNRSGKSDVSIDFKVDFKYFKFVNAIKITNGNKQDATNDLQPLEKNGVKLNFGGIGESNVM